MVIIKYNLISMVYAYRGCESQYRLHIGSSFGASLTLDARFQHNIPDSQSFEEQLAVPGRFGSDLTIV
jgi:hypothetical protein